MQFSDTTSDQGLVQDARWLVGANASSYPIKDLTRNINRRHEEAVALIFESDGRWQYTDSNNTEGIYTDDLVSGTQSYDILVSHLRITRVEIKNTDGNYARLQVLDQNDVLTTLTDYEKTDGTPRFYDLVGNKMYLYPAPNYASVDGLKSWFQTGPSLFTTTDTTKVPGFASLFHRYLSLGAAVDYANAKQLDNRNRLKEELDEMRDAMQHFYNRRAGDENIKIKVRTHNWN